MIRPTYFLKAHSVNLLKVIKSCKERFKSRLLYSYVYLAFIALTSLFTTVQAQVTRTFSTPGNGTFINPAGVTSLEIRLWGGGGGGGGSTSNGNGGGGGGGGGFLIRNVTVLSGPTGPVYNYTVGVGGEAGNAGSGWNGGNGGTTNITINAQNYEAFGGNGGISSAGGGGAGDGSTGTPGTFGTNLFSGGNGAAARINPDFSGGGGASAGPGTLGTGANGGNAVNQAGGTAVTGGGAGGNGTGGGIGANGGAPGGGGGGGLRTGGTDRNGGSGGAGQLSISYTCPTYAITSVSPARACNGSSSVVTLTGSLLPAGQYTVSYSIAGANSTASTQTATMNITTAGTGTFTIPGAQLSNPGTSTVTIISLHSGDVGFGCLTNLSVGANTQGTLITGNGTIALNSGNANQIICEFKSITDLVFAIGGTATGATATGLPIGLTSSFNNGIFSISGTPVQTGVFNYSVQTTGVPNPCINPSLSGSITVNAAPQGFLTGSPFICVSGIPNLIWNSTAGVGPFIIEYSDGTNSFIQNNVISGVAFAHPNTITANTNFTVTKVTSSQNCERTTGFTNASHTVPVNQLPTYTTTSPDQVCSGAPFTFVAVPNIAGTTLAWSRDVQPGISNPPASGSGLSFTENLNSTNPATGVSITYNLTFNNNGCTNAFPYVVTVFPQPVAPTLNTKSPAVDAVCVGQNVSATFNFGIGGIGCSDDFVVIINNGAPQPYNPGDLIPATLTGEIVIQGRRGNTCVSGCNATPYITLANWAVVPSPVAPTLQLKVPNIPDVCVGRQLSAQFNVGTGGFGCQDDYIWKIDGVIQGAYNPGGNISSASPGLVTIEGRRANCTLGTCSGTGYVQLASWNVVPNPVAPSLNTKIPNLPQICIGNPISITSNPGSDGVGCSDEYIITRDGAFVQSYNPLPPANIFTPTLIGTYEIRARRTNCNNQAGCTGTNFVTLASWVIAPNPLQPQVIDTTKIPNTNVVCSGTGVRVRFTAQGGPIGCGNILEYSTDNRATWQTYPNFSPFIPAPASGNIIIRAARGGCEGLGCITTPFTEVVWQVVPQPVSPTLAIRTPLAGSICFGNAVSATFNAGSGGVNCSDQYQAIIDGAAPVAYTPGASIGGSATTSIVIQARRAGCEALSGCTETNWTTVASWNVNANPTITTHPSTATPNVCVGGTLTSLSVTANAGSGSISGYQWYRNSTNSNVGGTLIPGEINANFTPPNNTPGTNYYYVVVTNSNGCTVTSNVSGAITVRNCFGINITGGLINIDCETLPVWYNGKGTVSGSSSLNGGSLGIYEVNSTKLSLRGGEIRIFKESGADVCGAKLFYRVYPNGGTPGAFSELDLDGTVENCIGSSFPSGGACSGSDQKWNKLDYNIELAFRPAGNYVIEFYFAAVGKHLSSGSCTELVVDDNNGNYYSKTFSVINSPTYTQGVGEFATSAFISNCTDNSFYNTTGFCANLIGVQPLNGNNLGTYVQGSNNLLLQGGELKSFQANDRWICGVNLKYRVYPQGSPSGTFETISLPWVSDCVSGSFQVGGGACSGNDKKWQANAAGVNLVGSRGPGTYVLEVYYEILANTTSNAQTCNQTIFVSNGGINYSGIFTVVPLALTYPNTPFCGSDAVPKTPTLTAATGFTGGTYSAPSGLSINATTGNITPSTSTPGTYTVTYQAPPVNGCTYTTTTSVTITALPTPVISYNGTPFCKTINSATVTLSGTNTGGGTYSATPSGLDINAVSGEINPSNSNAGGYLVTYKIPAQNGCAEATATTNISITALPTATISYPGICSNQSSGVNVTLTGTGAFAGGKFTSSTLGTALNEDNGRIIPTATLAGATSTSHKVFYTIPASGGCPEVVVETNPDVVITRRQDVQNFRYDNTPFCSSKDTAMLRISGVNIGYGTTGIFSAPGGLTINATTGLVDVSGSDPGAYTVTYTMPATGGCAQVILSFPDIITITQNPSATLSYSSDFYCSNTPGTFGPTISNGVGAFGGGTYSSTPVGLTMTTSGVITPSTSAASVDPYTITYTIPASGGCPTRPVERLVTITPAPTASFTYGGPFCSNDATPKPVLTMTGTNNYLGGTFSAPAGLIINPVTGAITPLGSTPGTYTVTYRTPAGNGCLEIPFTTNVTITQLPVINTFFYGGTPFCSNGAIGLPTLTTTPASIPNGNFSSNPNTLQIVNSTGAINPQTSTAGTYDVTYTIPSSGNCPAVSASTQVKITPLPDAAISYNPSIICPNSNSTPVTLVGSTGGVFETNSTNLSVNAITGNINASLSFIGDYTVFYKFVPADGCPQMIFQTNVSVRDNTAPLITTPSTISVECNLGTLPAITGQATATDNCTASPLLTYTDVVTPGSCPNRATVTRTWRAEDAYGNVSTSVQIINVEDNIPPIITCPANITVADPDAIPLPDISQITASDACGPVTVELLSETYEGLDGKPGFCPTKVFRTYQAIDACGNVATCTQIITVAGEGDCAICQSVVPFIPVDLSASPTASATFPDITRLGRCCNLPGSPPPTCVAFNVLLHPDAIGVRLTISSPAPQGQQWRIDCQEVSLTNGVICMPGGFFRTFLRCQPGAATNTYTFEAIIGAVVSDDFTTRVDCSNQISVAGVAAGTVTYTDITPGGSGGTLIPAPGGLTATFVPGISSPPTVQYSVCGTLASGGLCGSAGAVDCDTITITVIPPIEPTVTVPKDVCVNNLQPLAVADIFPSVGTYSYEWLNASNVVVGTGASYTPGTPGDYWLRVTETQLGIACNVETFGPYNVTFDATPPTVTAPSTTLQLQCNPGANYAVAINNWLVTATASDNVALANPGGLTNNYAPVTQSCGLIQPVTFTATDHCGLTSTAIANIQYIDTVPPTITCPTALSFECASQVTAPIGNDKPAFQTAGGNFNDICDPNASLAWVSDVISNQSCPNVFTISRTYKAVDACNNEVSCTQTINVKTISNPAVPANVSVNVACIADAIAPAPGEIPVVVDACGSPITPIPSVTPTIPCNGGTYVYSYTYTDCSGLSATWSKIYSVPPDNTPPTITAPATINLCRLPSGTYTIPAISASDNCGSPVVNSYTITGTTTTRSGTGLDASGAFELGVSTIEWKSVDICGNERIVTTTVNVIDVPTAAIDGSIVSCPGQTVQIPITVTGIGVISGTIMPGNIAFSGTAGVINVSVTAPSATTTYTISAVSIGVCPGTVSGSGFTITIPGGTVGTWSPTQCIAAGTADWYDCRNWAGGIVPTASTNVVIPASAACDPVIDINSPLSGNMAAVTNSITIEGRTLKMLAGSNLNVYGNWTNNAGAAGFDAGGGTVAFRGSGNQTITTTAPGGENFNNLVVNKTGGNVILGSQANVSGTLTLTNGIVDARTANLNLTNCNMDAIIGGGNDSYLYGNLTRCTNSTSVYTFPVGDPNRPGGGYRPAYVQPSDVAQNTFTARYYYGIVPEQGFSNLIGGVLTGVVDNEQWAITGSNCPSSEAYIGFDYIYNGTTWAPVAPAAACGGTNQPQCSNVGVVYKPGSWTFTDLPNQQGDGFSIDSLQYRFYNSNGRLWSKKQDYCGTNYFSIGHGFATILPIRLLNFTGILHNKQAWLQWTVADNEEVRSFDIEHSTDGQTYNKVGQVNKGNNPAYQYLHDGLEPGNNYYRLQMNGKDGTRLTSKVVVIPYGRPMTYIVSLNPTLVRDMTQLTVVSARAQSVEIRIMDMRGRLIRTERAQLQLGNNIIPVYVRGLSNAMYMLLVATEDGAQATYKILKE